MTRWKGSYDEDHVHADKQRAFIITMTDQLWNRKSATWSDVLSANRTAKCSAVSPFSCHNTKGHLAIKKGPKDPKRVKGSRKWEGETCFLTCKWHGSGWLRSVLSAYSCNRLKTSRLRTASCRYLRFVSGEPLLRCANCHSIYFESMKSLRTALLITLNILVF